MQDIRNKAGQTLEEFLAAYDVTKYDRPCCTVDNAVFTLDDTSGSFELAVLLIKRGNHPWIGSWALPGGFIEMDEDLITAARRELEEETGVTGLAMREIGAFGDVDRDPRARVITTAYLALAPAGELCHRAGDDAADSALFSVTAFLEAYSAPAETYRMELMGPRVITCRATLRYNELGSYPERFANINDGGLGGDHDLILFSALRELSLQPRDRLAFYLTRNCPERYSEALDALENALSAIPTEI